MNVTIIYHCGVLDVIKPFYRELNRLGCRVSIIVPKKVMLDPIYYKDQCLTLRLHANPVLQGGASMKRSESTLIKPRLSERGASNGLTAQVTDQEASFRYFPINLINIRRYNLGFNPFELYQSLKASAPDLIHVFNEYHCFPVAEVIFIRNHLWKRRVPVIIYGFQNIDYLKVRCLTLRDFVKKVIRKIIVDYNVKYLSGITAASSEALEIVKQHNPRLRAQRIFWGVDLKTFFPKDKKVCRQQLNLPQDKKIIGYFGRMVEEKGIEALLRAVALLKRREDVLLVLIGEGDFCSTIPKLAGALAIQKNIIYKPSIDFTELSAYYNSLDCFVLASQTRVFWKEQYGRVLVEAMACGIPIVASQSGSIPDVLEGYALSIVVKEGDVDSLAEAMTWLIYGGPKREDFSINRFSMENFAQEHMEFYKSFSSFGGARNQSA